MNETTIEETAPKAHSKKREVTAVAAAIAVTFILGSAFAKVTEVAAKKVQTAIAPEPTTTEED
jgi:hypothetical protein